MDKQRIIELQDDADEFLANINSLKDSVKAESFLDFPPNDYEGAIDYCSRAMEKLERALRLLNDGERLSKKIKRIKI